MKRLKGIGFLVMCVITVCTTWAGAVTSTIATFADPAADSTAPLFEVDLTNGFIRGEWDDSQTNLNLNVVYSGHIFNDAFFTMTPVSYSGDITGGVTGGGVIMFRMDGQGSGATAITPLIRIEFDSAYISLTGFGAVEMFTASNITITGTEIDIPLTNESFSFSFANYAPLSEGEGFTATAAFTSSATIPEPATLTLLGVGLLMALTRKKRSARAMLK